MSVKCQKSFTLTVNSGLQMLGYWQMEEAGGDRVDATGRGAPMHEVLGNAIGNTAGEIDNAASITNDRNTPRSLGTDSVASLVYDPTKGLTVTGWFKYVGAISGEGGFQVFDLANYGAEDSLGNSIFFLTIKVSGIIPNQSIRGQITDALGGFYQINGPVKNDNVAMFYCMWVDPADNLFRIQLDNGVPLVHASTVDLGTGHAKGFARGSGNNPSNAGIEGYASLHYSDEVCVWNKVLTALERTTLYNNYVLGIRPPIA